MITGNEVYLRAVEKEDLPEIYKWSSDFELKELFGFTMNFLAFSEFVEDYERNCTRTDCIDYIIVEKDTKKPVGQCMLTDIDYINKKCQCSLYIGDRESVDKGYGAEAMNLLMKFAFENLNLNRLGLCVFEFNKRAIRSYKKCGMKVEGIIREGIYRNGKYHDIYFMGILKYEYESLFKGGGEECSEVNM